MSALDNSERNMQILIADDSIVSRHLLEATLGKWGYEVAVACDGLEAWNLLQRKDAPRIAILDWVMPGLSGPEVCKRLRERDADQADYTYILLLTSKVEREDFLEGMESGADDYLTKPFDQPELKVRLRAGNRIVALQRELVEAREKLRDQATRDSLTGLWNRPSVLDAFERELARAQRDQTPVGVVMADLDRFKSVNDTFGHLAGDAMLKEFARRMLACVRPYDTIGRYGGEEFLIVLSNCEDLCTENQAERMRNALAGHPMLIGDHQHSITASFGATTWKPGIPPNLELLIRAADTALYQAKNQGRNRTVSLPCPDEAGSL